MCVTCSSPAGVKEIDIAATLEHVRDQRPGMVRTKVRLLANVLLNKGVNQKSWSRLYRFWIHDQISVGHQVGGGTDGLRVKEAPLRFSGHGFNAPKQTGQRSADLPVLRMCFKNSEVGCPKENIWPSILYFNNIDVVNPLFSSGRPSWRRMKGNWASVAFHPPEESGALVSLKKKDKNAV